MGVKQTVEGEVEVKCSPHKLLELLKGKQEQIPNICSDKVTAVQPHHLDIDTTSRWDYVQQGEARYLTARIDSVDEENNTMVFTMIDGDIMNMYYKTFVSRLEAIAKEEGGCLVKWSFEYEKLKEDAPEPQPELHFVLSVTKDLGDHRATKC